jgi:hypothetical protein
VLGGVSGRLRHERREQPGYADTPN